MDWKRIKDLYPKSFKLLESQKMFTKILSRQNIRLLYDFFDQNSLYIYIGYETEYTREIDEDGNNPHYSIEDWWWKIDDNEVELAVFNVQEKSRINAEKVAFEKAFEILEERL
jgi:hypothetical protein